jgi:enoyl-CoA hydratase/carnithine racemase
MADYSKYTALKLDLEDRLITITINRPEAMNSVTTEMHQELEQLWCDIAADDSIHAVIITGAGQRAFCTGADVKAMSARNAEAGPAPAMKVARSMVGPKRLIANMLEVEQPIIAAVNGDAIGMGASIALSADIVICSERARLADTHVKNLGVACGDGGTVTWPLMMGIHKAKEYLLTGAFLYGDEAARMGWINYAVPPDEVMPKAREMAMKFVNGPTWAARYTKTAVNKIQRNLLNLTMDTALLGEWLNFAQSDHKEAVAAWMEKRPGVYTGG